MPTRHKSPHAPSQPPRAAPPTRTGGERRSRKDAARRRSRGRARRRRASPGDWPDRRGYRARGADRARVSSGDGADRDTAGYAVPARRQRGRSEVPSSARRPADGSSRAGGQSPREMGCTTTSWRGGAAGAGGVGRVAFGGCDDLGVGPGGGRGAGSSSARGAARRVRRRRGRRRPASSCSSCAGRAARICPRPRRRSPSAASRRCCAAWRVARGRCSSSRAAPARSRAG